MNYSQKILQEEVNNLEKERKRIIESIIDFDKSDELYNALTKIEILVKELKVSIVVLNTDQLL